MKHEHLKLTLFAIVLCVGLLMLGCSSKIYYGKGYSIWTIEGVKYKPAAEVVAIDTVKSMVVKKKQSNYEREKNAGDWYNLPK